MSDRAEPSLQQVFLYSLPALPLAVLTLPFYILIPSFYAQNLGLSLAAVGSALLIVRLLDALSDPMIGVLADRWHPTFGRRRSWFALASIPAVMAAWFVFVPERGASSAYLTVWGAILSVSWTAITVPYAAWGAEMSTSYAGRARVVAWRESFGVIGTVVALSATAIVPLLGFSGQANVLLALAVFVALGVPISVGLAVTRLPEPHDATSTKINFRQGVALLRENRPFVRLLSAFFLNGCGNGFPATLFLFFVTDRLRADNSAGPLLLLYFFCGIIGVPFWLWLARKTSKHRAWACGMIMACVCFSAAPFLAAGQVWPFALVCIGTGLALGADLVLAPAIQADVIDVDTANSGSQRAGLYFALWGFATKLALALAVGVAFPLLSWSGFDPAKHMHTEFGLATLAVLYAIVPIILKIGAVKLVWNFPIDAEAQSLLRQRIEASRQSSVSAFSAETQGGLSR